MARRQLPDFYKRMVEVGARSHDLPGMLTLLADHYQRANAVLTRLKGLMVYPLLVVLVSLGLTLFLWMVLRRFIASFSGVEWTGAVPTIPLAAAWIPPLVFLALALAMLGVIFIPSWRAAFRWRLPAFREASLANFASSMALMLRNGIPLADALALSEKLETGSPAARAVADWRGRIAAGQGKPAQWPDSSKPFPELFWWLLRRSGEDLAAGFEKAASLYQTRALYRTELLLYGALPVAILLLGQMVVWQIAPLVAMLVRIMNMLGN